MGHGSRAAAWRAALLGVGSGGARVLLLLARARRFTYPARSSKTREAFLGCTSHAADLQQRAESGEDYRIFGGVVTDDWVGAVQASSSLGLCDCVLASSGI
jgi:hypothetical protein